ncbi:MAG: hypothetical protein ACP5PX_04750 [Candidatus Hadarchaeum sp.]|uniref:hypothetical protein n=1 Tax=Candidatus Hadarchaeum sp. TaxID=2883567 RepID=UPI003D14782B
MRKIIIIAAVLVVAVLAAGLIINLGKRPPAGTESPPETTNTTPSTAEEEHYTFTRDWLREGNIWVFDQPSTEYLEELGATGTAFSVYYSGFNEYEWNYVKDLHRNGFKVTSNLPCEQSATTENLQLREEACQRDVYGDPVLLLGLEGLYKMCGNNPLWRDFLMNRIAEQARGDVDGILLDEPGDVGDCFCGYCMQAFNNYLAEHYSPDELEQLFGITDLTAFSYREYLLGQGGAHWWDDPNPQLQSTYLQFRYLERTRFLGELVRHGKQAAGWDIPVTANVYGLEPNHQIFVPLLDFVIFEMPTIPEAHPGVDYLRPIPGKHFVTYLLAEALDRGKPFSAFPDVFDLQQLSEEDWWLWRHWLAEARACGASFMLPHRAYVYGGGAYTIAAEKVSPYTQFFARHPQYYENLDRVATVALLHDLHSTLINRFTWLAPSAWNSFKSIGITLQEAHIPFEVVYRGDGTFVQRPLALAELQKYRVVVVPRDYDLDPEALALLEQYAAAGGLVIRCDDLADDSQLVPVLRGLGVDLGVETNAAEDLGLVVYRGDSSLLIHMLNYRYDRGTRDFLDLTNVEVTLTVPEGVVLEGKQLKIISPDEEGRVLNFLLQDGKVTFTVPNIHCYSVASFE